MAALSQRCPGSAVFLPLSASGLFCRGYMCEIIPYSKRSCCYQKEVGTISTLDCVSKWCKKSKVVAGCATLEKTQSSCCCLQILKIISGNLPTTLANSLIPVEGVGLCGSETFVKQVDRILKYWPFIGQMMILVIIQCCS